MVNMHEARLNNKGIICIDTLFLSRSLTIDFYILLSNHEKNLLMLIIRWQNHEKFIPNTYLEHILQREIYFQIMQMKRNLSYMSQSLVCIFWFLNITNNSIFIWSFMNKSFLCQKNKINFQGQHFIKWYLI